MRELAGQRKEAERSEDLAKGLDAVKSMDRKVETERASSGAKRHQFRYNPPMAYLFIRNGKSIRQMYV